MQSCSHEQNPSWRRMPWKWSTWRGILAPKAYLAGTFRTDGQPDPEYAGLEALRQWIIDMCTSVTRRGWTTST